jgi:hypothetical protein
VGTTSRDRLSTLHRAPSPIKRRSDSPRARRARRCDRPVGKAASRARPDRRGDDRARQPHPRSAERGRPGATARRRDASSSSAPAVSDITTAFAPERQSLDIRQASTTALPARAVVSARAKSWRRPLSFSAARPSSVGAEQERRRIVGVDHEPLVDATVAFAICAGGRRIRASLPGGVACRGM